MDDKIVAGAIGAVFGFALPYLTSVWERTRKAHRIISALSRELSEVTEEIEVKMKWIGRPITEHLNEVDKDRIIEVNGTHLYLGEREKFVVPRIYWRARYTEIAETIPDKDFSDFYTMYRLVDKFEQKFREMKLTFGTSLGIKDKMALACFKDLEAISKDLRNRLTNRSSGRS